MANVHKLITSKLGGTKSKSSHPYKKRNNRSGSNKSEDVAIQLDKLLVRFHTNSGFQEVSFSKDEILAIGREVLADVPVSFY